MTGTWQEHPGRRRIHHVRTMYTATMALATCSIFFVPVEPLPDGLLFRTAAPPQCRNCLRILNRKPKRKKNDA